MEARIQEVTMAPTIHTLLLTHTIVLSMKHITPEEQIGAIIPHSAKETDIAAVAAIAMGTVDVEKFKYFKKFC